MKKIALLSLVIITSIAANATTIAPPPQYELRSVINTSGTGLGKITISAEGKTKSHAGLTSTSTRIKKLSQVTLTATPNINSVFAGWTGDCSGKDTCRLNMNSSKSVTAKFNLRSNDISQDQVMAASSTCAKAALTKRDATVIPALQKYTTDWITSMNTRSEKQKLAYDKIGSERTRAISQSRVEAKATQAQISRTLSIAKSQANTTYNLELKICGVGSQGNDE